MNLENLSATPESGTPAPLDGRALDQALVRGVAWTGLARWGSQILSWAATIMIARLLTKADYGLLGMANLYIGFVLLVNEFGLGAAIVRRRDLGHAEISALGTLSVAAGVGLWAVSAVLATPFAWFFDEPAVRWLILALGVTFVTSALRTLPRALLTRDLQFHLVAMIDALEAIVAAAVTLTLAWYGWSYWSLAVGAIAGSAVSALYALRLRPHPLGWSRRLHALKEHLTFGGHIVGARMAWYGYSNADMAVVGRVLGKELLGAYSFGWTLATIPVGRIAGLLGQVTPGIFSAVQHDRTALRRYFLLITEGVAFLSFPAAAGLALVAEDLVLVALGEHWRAAIVPLQILGAYGAFRSITTMFPPLLQAVGRSGEAMRFNLIALLVLPPLFLIGTRWGTTGVAAAWVIGYPLVMIRNYRAILDATDCRLGQYLKGLWPAVSATLVMILAVLVWKLWAPSGAHRSFRLAGQVAVGALTYALMAGIFYRARLLSALALLGWRR